MKLLNALFFMILAATAISNAADLPYNETADAKLDIKQALTQAATAKTPVIVVFGANWCGDCRALDVAMKTGASAPLLSRDFKIVKVDVGQINKNLDIAKSYGVPLEKGIPAVAIISTNNEVLYATRAGELADARKMSDNGIYEFFKRVTASTATTTMPKDKPGSMMTQEGVTTFDRAIAPYVAQARATYPAAKKRFLAGLPANQTLFLTTRLHDKDGKWEQVFIMVERIKDDKVTGTISSDLITVKGFKRGQKYTFPESDILDWLISSTDGTEEGNVVGKFLDTYKP